jgi:hypothetical protein
VLARSCRSSATSAEARRYAGSEVLGCCLQVRLSWARCACKRQKQAQMDKREKKSQAARCQVRIIYESRIAGVCAKGEGCLAYPWCRRTSPCVVRVKSGVQEIAPIGIATPNTSSSASLPSRWTRKARRPSFIPIRLPSSQGPWSTKRAVVHKAGRRRDTERSHAVIGWNQSLGCVRSFAGDQKR